MLWIRKQNNTMTSRTNPRCGAPHSHSEQGNVPTVLPQRPQITSPAGALQENLARKVSDAFEAVEDDTILAAVASSRDVLTTSPQDIEGIIRARAENKRRIAEADVALAQCDALAAGAELRQELVAYRQWESDCLEEGTRQLLALQFTPAARGISLTGFRNPNRPSIPPTTPPPLLTDSASPPTAPLIKPPAAAQPKKARKFEGKYWHRDLSRDPQPVTSGDNAIERLPKGANDVDTKGPLRPATVQAKQEVPLEAGRSNISGQRKQTVKAHKADHLREQLVDLVAREAGARDATKEIAAECRALAAELENPPQVLPVPPTVIAAGPVAITFDHTSDPVRVATPDENPEEIREDAVKKRIPTEPQPLNTTRLDSFVAYEVDEEATLRLRQRANLLGDSVFSYFCLTTFCLITTFLSLLFIRLVVLCGDAWISLFGPAPPPALHWILLVHGLYSFLWLYWYLIAAVFWLAVWTVRLWLLKVTSSPRWINSETDPHEKRYSHPWDNVPGLLPQAVSWVLEFASRDYVEARHEFVAGFRLQVGPADTPDYRRHASRNETLRFQSIVHRGSIIRTRVVEPTLFFGCAFAHETTRHEVHYCKELLAEALAPNIRRNNLTPTQYRELLDKHIPFNHHINLLRSDPILFHDVIEGTKDVAVLMHIFFRSKAWTPGNRSGEGLTPPRH